MKTIKMPHYPKGIEKEFSRFVVFMIERMADKFKKQVILGMNKSTVKKFADAQTGNYAVVFRALAARVSKKLLKQFSNEAIEKYSNMTLSKADKFNRDKTYNAMESVFGIDQKQLVRQEALSRKIKPLILETAQWAEKLRDDTLEKFTANTLRSMSMGTSIDKIVNEFDLSVSKNKNAAKFIARNQIASFNGLLTKVRFQKAGVTKGVWKTSQDEVVRPCHKAREGQVFDLSEGCFSKCDGKYLFPGTDYNCRCIMLGVVDEFEELEN